MLYHLNTISLVKYYLGLHVLNRFFYMFPGEAGIFGIVKKVLLLIPPADPEAQLTSVIFYVMYMLNVLSCIKSLLIAGVSYVSLLHFRSPRRLKTGLGDSRLIYAYYSAWWMTFVISSNSIRA